MSGHRAAAAAAWVLSGVMALAAGGPARAERPLAGGPALLAPGAWTAVPADGVELSLAADDGPEGRPALRLDYDFHGHGGWAAARLPLPRDLPENWELRFTLRGIRRTDTAPNHLEVKLVDPSGDNVWWHVDRDLAWPDRWTPREVKKRQVAFAWGPRGSRPGGAGELATLGALELAITAGGGGSGSLWIADLELVEVPPPRPPDGPPRAVDDAGGAPRDVADHGATAAVDGDPDTAWRPRAAPPAALTVDLRGTVPMGALTLRWEPGRAPRRARVERSGDGGTWTPVRTVEPGAGAGPPAAESHLLLGDVDARYLRVTLGEDDCPRGCGLAEVVVRPPAAGATPNAFFQALAAEAPRGSYPRGFTQAEYWTVVGVDGAVEEALMSEDGTVEVGERGISLEPFVRLDGRLWGWADVAAERSLADGDLPIPTVAWPLPGLRLEITALAAAVGRGDAAALADGGAGGRSVLWVRYRLRNTSGEREAPRLVLAARPFQVNPPYQFLNVVGGVTRVPGATCEVEGGGLKIRKGKRTEAGPAEEVTVEAAPAPGRCGAMPFDAGRLVDHLEAGELPVAQQVDDPTGWASAVIAWDLDLAPGEARDVVVRVPFPAEPGPPEPPTVASGSLGSKRAPVGASSPPRPDAGFVASRPPEARPAGAPPAAAARPSVPTLAEGVDLDLDAEIDADLGVTDRAPVSAPAFDAAFEATRRHWRRALDQVTLDLPPEAGPLAATLRSSLAWILIHRDGPAIQPGSRAYARSWIRDGALTGTALLRLGQTRAAEEFAAWFAGFQYADGKVPCCVDRRGADPVPENDSHGELIHLVTEVYRYTGDAAFARRLFPHVAAAVGYLDALRAQRRTDELRQGDAAIFFGLLPESISHEGYSAKPVHSYWDDAFAYRGLADADELAAALGRDELARRWAADRDEFRADLLASIAEVRRRNGIAFLPGSAELADFDSTATTVSLDPAGLGPVLPRAAVDATFDRFWQRFVARRDGALEWDAYTPYEIRHVGAFVRLGWRRRAGELLDFYLADRRPPAWNGWPEVVTRDVREPRFLGDLPHGWVASDFIRSLLDLFAYEGRTGVEQGSAGDSLVLAAGVQPGWLARPEGVAIRGLRTPWGELGYRLARRGDGVRYELVPSGLRVPPGGLVLTWPFAGRAAAALVDGEPAALAADGTLVLHRVPLDAELLAAAPAAPPPEEDR